MKTRRCVYTAVRQIFVGGNSSAACRYLYEQKRKLFAGGSREHGDPMLHCNLFRLPLSVSPTRTAGNDRGGGVNATTLLDYTSCCCCRCKTLCCMIYCSSWRAVTPQKKREGGVAQSPESVPFETPRSDRSLCEFVLFVPSSRGDGHPGSRPRKFQFPPLRQPLLFRFNNGETFSAWTRVFSQFWCC